MRQWAGVHVWSVCGWSGVLVPSAPRGLRLSIVQEEPPVIAASWQAPRQTRGRLTAYRLRYGVVDDDQFPAEVRQLDAEKYRFTTGFLGQCLSVDAALNEFLADTGQSHPNLSLSAIQVYPPIVCGTATLISPSPCSNWIRYPTG